MFTTFAQQRNRWCWKSAIRMFLEMGRSEIIWYLQVLKPYSCDLFTVYDSWDRFSAKIWFVKTSTWIVKYDSRFVKSNHDICCLHCHSSWKIKHWLSLFIVMLKPLKFIKTNQRSCFKMIVAQHLFKRENRTKIFLPNFVSTC